jgi:hypothetical protein
MLLVDLERISPLLGYSQYTCNLVEVVISARYLAERFDCGLTLPVLRKVAKQYVGVTCMQYCTKPVFTIQTDGGI